MRKTNPWLPFWPEARSAEPGDEALRIVAAIVVLTVIFEALRFLPAELTAELERAQSNQAAPLGHPQAYAAVNLRLRARTKWQCAVRGDFARYAPPRA